MTARDIDPDMLQDPALKGPHDTASSSMFRLKVMVSPSSAVIVQITMPGPHCKTAA